MTKAASGALLVDLLAELRTALDAGEPLAAQATMTKLLTAIGATPKLDAATLSQARALAARCEESAAKLNLTLTEVLGKTGTSRRAVAAYTHATDEAGE